MNARASIATEHLLGATIRCYGAGAARVVAWSRRDHYSRLRSRLRGVVA